MLVLLLAVQALAQPDPYRAMPKDVPQRLAYQAERGGGRQDQAVERWLRGHPDASPASRAMLAHRLCVDYGVLVGGERRVAACRLSVALSGNAEDRSDLSLAQAFRNVPPIAGHGRTTVALVTNPLGSRSAAVTVGGTTLPWFVDTGAEITTLPESTAARLGVRPVDGAADVGTSTSIHVQGRLGVIDRLTIGDASVEHVPVLILPDAMLTLAKDYVIPGIVGLPVLASLQRAAWLDRGERLALGADAPAPGVSAARIYWHEDGLGVPLTTALGTRGVHLDTGANASQLTSSGLTLLAPEQMRTIAEHDTRTGGAGGFVDAKVKILPHLEFTLAGAPLMATDLTVGDGGAGAGTLGSDILPQLQRLVLDFDEMTLEAVPSAR